MADRVIKYYFILLESRKTSSGGGYLLFKTLAHLSEWPTELSTTSYYLNQEQLPAGLSTLQDYNQNRVLWAMNTL